MNNLISAILLSVILLNFFILGTSRLGACIKVTAFQGGLLAVLPPLA